jgi:hypothetical protein
MIGYGGTVADEGKKEGGACTLAANCLLHCHLFCKYIQHKRTEPTNLSPSTWRRSHEGHCQLLMFGPGPPWLQ